MTSEKCSKCGSTVFAVARDMKATRHCGCGHTWLPEKSKIEFTPEQLDEAMRKAQEESKAWFKSRGFTESDMMYADAAFKEYLRVEQNMPDNRGHDKAPGFRRLFMMGYFYGRAAK